MPEEREVFPGLISGYPEVAVDRFVGRCLDARYFLLSHLHTDHMQGLASPELLAVLEKLPGPRLLLSRQSAALLASWPQYAALLPHLCPLEVGEPRQLTGRLVVTPLPAAHCPGSVMFLLEAGDGGTVLFTGDFRLSQRQLAEMKPLHDADGRPKTIDVLYADTTFCVPGRRELPDRRRSTDCVERLVTEWLGRGPSHRVNLVCPARYGYEQVFRRLHESTGMRVHVTSENSQLYERLPDISRCVTPHADQTRLHSLHPNSPCLRDSTGGPLRSIKLSTLFHFNNQDVDSMELHLGGENYRVLYSTHASLSQVQGMVAYLKPGRVVPCVEPPGSSLEAVLALLDGAGRRGSEPEHGPEGEPDSRRPPLLRGGGWERQPKRALPPETPVENGLRQDRLAAGAAVELKRTRTATESPLRHQAAPLRHQAAPLRHQESPLRHQESPSRYQGRQGRQEAPLHAAGRVAEQAAIVDTRPAWKCPFDSD